MPGLSILKYLKLHGEQLDVDIAAALSIPLDRTRRYLTRLAADGDVMTYSSTRFVGGVKVEGVRCRLVRYASNSTGAAEKPV